MAFLRIYSLGTVVLLSLPKAYSLASTMLLRSWFRQHSCTRLEAQKEAHETHSKSRRSFALLTGLSVLALSGGSPKDAEASFAAYYATRRRRPRRERIGMKEPVKISDGVSYVVKGLGSGKEVVKLGSKVCMEMTIRVTENDGDVSYLSTKKKLEMIMGSGDVILPLEMAMLGMRQYARRDVEIRSKIALMAENAAKLPLPANIAGRVEALSKTDTPILFEVFVTSIS